MHVRSSLVFYWLQCQLAWNVRIFTYADKFGCAVWFLLKFSWSWPIMKFLIRVKSNSDQLPTMTFATAVSPLCSTSFLFTLPSKHHCTIPHCLEFSLIDKTTQSCICIFLWWCTFTWLRKLIFSYCDGQTILRKNIQNANIFALNEKLHI